MLGCAYSVTCDVRAGIWDRRFKPNTKTNALMSLVGGAFIFVWGLIKFAELGIGLALLFAAIIGACTFALALAVFQICMKFYQKRHAELENPKEDDDENE